MPTVARGPRSSYLKPVRPRPKLPLVGLRRPDPWVSPLKGGDTTSDYAMEWIDCRDCGAQARYFVWSADEPPEPRPTTVFRDLLYPSKKQFAGTRRGWWNHCGECGIVLDA